MKNNTENKKGSKFLLFCAICFTGVIIILIAAHYQLLNEQIVNISLVGWSLLMSFGSFIFVLSDDDRPRKPPKLKVQEEGDIRLYIPLSGK